jgi:hypothetical protein
MLFNKKSLLFLLILFCAGSTIAQHHTVWVKAIVRKPVSKKIHFDGELHFRTQNGWLNNNPFGKKLLLAFRPMIYYKKNKNLTLAVSPLAYFSNYKTIVNESDAAAAPGREYRVSAFAEYRHALQNTFSLFIRTGAEYRMLQTAAKNIIRSRTRLLLRKELKNGLTLAAGDELFLNGSGVPGANFFDHNRVQFLASLHINGNCILELGYIHTNRLLRSSLEYIREESLVFHLIFGILPRKDQ